MRLTCISCPSARNLARFYPAVFFPHFYFVEWGKLNGQLYLLITLGLGFLGLDMVFCWGFFFGKAGPLRMTSKRTNKNNGNRQKQRQQQRQIRGSFPAFRMTDFVAFAEGRRVRGRGRGRKVRTAVALRGRQRQVLRLRCASLKDDNFVGRNEDDNFVGSWVGRITKQLRRGG